MSFHSLPDSTFTECSSLAVRCPRSAAITADRFFSSLYVRYCRLSRSSDVGRAYTPDLSRHRFRSVSELLTAVCPPSSRSRSGVCMSLSLSLSLSLSVSLSLFQNTRDAHSLGPVMRLLRRCIRSCFRARVESFGDKNAATAAAAAAATSSSSACVRRNSSLGVSRDRTPLTPATSQRRPQRRRRRR